MPYLVSGRIVEPCQLSPAEYFTLAVREWEVVLDWMACGRALGYGRLSGGGGGAILLDVESEAEARALARSLPFAPYAEVSIAPVDRADPASREAAALLGARLGAVGARRAGLLDEGHTCRG